MHIIRSSKDELLFLFLPLLRECNVEKCTAHFHKSTQVEELLKGSSRESKRRGGGASGAARAPTLKATIDHTRPRRPKIVVCDPAPLYVQYEDKIYIEDNNKGGKCIKDPHQDRLYTSFDLFQRHPPAQCDPTQSYANEMKGAVHQHNTQGNPDFFFCWHQD